MQTFIIVTHVVAAVILVLTVLLQAGKGAGMGAAFGGSSSSVFGARGPATFISKITCAAAVIFMATSLSLTLMQKSSGESIMDNVSAIPVPASPAPASPAPASPAPVENAVPTENSAN